MAALARLSVGLGPAGCLTHLKHFGGPLADLTGNLAARAGDDRGDLAHVVEPAFHDDLNGVLADLQLLEHGTIVSGAIKKGVVAAAGLRGLITEDRSVR